jgi:pimeloyl-ACP methyl ester carboxylesterase
VEICIWHSECIKKSHNQKLKEKNMQIILKNLSVFIIIITSMQISIAQEKAGALTLEPYVFENSKKEKINAEFGRLKVPENRGKKNDKLIELSFVRFKSTSQNPGSPIIYLAGGPGGSGIQAAKDNRFKLFMAMREFGDVIAFDQRGTGQSTPGLICSNKLNLPLDKALSREDYTKKEAEKMRICADYWEKQGVDVSAYNTVESAHDINDLRKALGAKKVSLWGISYGTHLALATIRLHGKNIDRSILAGVEGTDDTLKLPQNTEKLLIELDRHLQADSKLSKTIPDFIRLMKKVHERLEAKPVIVEVTDPKTKKKINVTIGKFDLQFLFSAFSGNTGALSIMPGLYGAMERGDFSFVAGQMVKYRQDIPTSLMSVAMDCASGVSDRRSAQIQKEKQTTIFGDAINAPFPEICREINNAELGNDFRKPVQSKVPVLFISGTLDGRTPVSNADLVIKGFQNGKHLIIDGAGHSDPLFLSSPQIEETMKKFMKREKLPSKIEIETSTPFKFQ